MKKYETKEVTITKTVEKVIGIVCDECKNDIPNKEYFEVTTSHNQWGNDSIDSVNELDICSLNCLTKNMNEYYKNGSHTYQYEIEQVRR